MEKKEVKMKGWREEATGEREREELDKQEAGARVVIPERKRREGERHWDG